ncbi:ABC transporter substrate-binding protein [Plantactinospora sp. S1510]|uniref:ABC transporter substrate-binding protein n=1 Tax=Plantactinospora alkalitolerans TaxID=2789879 RepID=A0ABS0HAL0_9ACTN|nr:ABC transporter substrate-binding protein [Plantactinospora alkalitolerans]MBF9135493.1 ABC transporter substrate-binding protein [Plantactinospora alkalitolerans]
MAVPTVEAWTLSRRGLLAAAATTLLAACGREEERTGPSGSDARELVVGASLELSGVGKALGAQQERALRITTDILNEGGVPVGNLRRNIRLVVRDNASDPRLAAQHTTELATRDNVHALIGGCLAETSLAIAPVAQQQHLPFISFAAADNITLPLSQRTFIFKLTPDARDVARALAQLIRTQRHERVGLLVASGPHGDSGVRAVTAALKGVNSDLVRSVRLPRAEDADLGPAAERIAAKNPDAVVVWATAPFSGAAARALRKADYTGPILFDPGAVAEETLSEKNTPAVEGAYAVHPISLGGSSLTNTTTAGLARRDFVYRYVHEHGSFSGFAPYASDAVQLVVNAARLAKSVDRGRLRAYLGNQITEGIAGAYSFAPIRHGGMDADSLGIFTVSSGAWSRVS